MTAVTPPSGSEYSYKYDYDSYEYDVRCTKRRITGTNICTGTTGSWVLLVLLAYIYGSDIVTVLIPVQIQIQVPEKLALAYRLSTTVPVRVLVLTSFHTANPIGQAARRCPAPSPGRLDMAAVDSATSSAAPDDCS
eukprot:scaffold61910_cov23-Prasinocladus_malaysianus.AAC.1